MPDRAELAERVHALLILLYPRDFRERYGHELQSAVRESMRIEGERRSRFSVAFLVAWDVVRSATAMRVAGLRRWGTVRNRGGGGMMNAWTQSIRLAIRGLRRRPGFTLVAAATMALGIAASSTIFSLVHAVLLKPMPFEEPDELVFVWSDFSRIGVPRGWLSGPQTVRLDEEADLFDGFAVLRGASVDVAGADGAHPRRVRANQVTANLFDLLGVAAAFGRTFSPGEDGAGAPQVVVLGNDLWTTQFGADPSLVGKDVYLDGLAYRVVGIMPRGFVFRMHSSLGAARAPDLWVPLDVDLASLPVQSHSLAALGRMKDGVSIEQAAAQLEALGQRYGKEKYRVDDFRLYPVALQADLVKEVRPALLMLAGGVGLLLLIVVANLATLFLGRSAMGETDVAIRTALGAGRGAILTLSLSESLFIALVGGLAGLACSAWTLDAFVGLVPNGIPRSEEISVGWATAGVTTLVTLLVGLAAGLIPARRTSRGLAEVLREGGARGGVGLRARLAQRGLVVAQVAISALLLAGAGLLGRSLLALADVDPGFDPVGVVTAAISLPSNRYPDADARRAMMDRILERLEGAPDVKAVGLTTATPLSAAADQTPLELGAAEISPGSDDGPKETMDWWRATEGYVEAMGLRVVEGRSFTREDRGQQVVMIDEVLARRYWPTSSPLGAYIDREPDGSGGERIVGVVSHGRLYNVYEDDRGQAIFPMATRPPGGFVVTVRTAGPTDRMVPFVRSAIAAVDPALPVDIQTMEEVVAESLARWRFSLALMALFAAAALFLSGLGVYGVISYGVTRRTRELGIRMALGADRGSVIRLVTGQGLRLVGLGLAVGLLASLGLGRFLGALLYGVAPSDVVTAGCVAAVLLSVALASAALPARRATRISPTEAFRSE